MTYNVLTVLGLCYDISGAILLGLAVIGNRAEKIALLVRTGWGHNKHAIPAVVEQRNDGWVGLVLLVGGFALQMANEFWKPGDWLLVWGLGVLGVMVVAYLSVRRRLVERGEKAVVVALEARRGAAKAS